MDDSHSPPKYQEAFHAAQDLQACVRVLRVFHGALTHGPLPYQRWDCVDQVIAAMHRLQDLAAHEPTRQVMQQDHEGTGQALALLFDPQLQQMLTEIQRIRSGCAGAEAQPSEPAHEGGELR